LLLAAFFGGESIASLGPPCFPGLIHPIFRNDKCQLIILDRD
jgi:hypothetical protein